MEEFFQIITQFDGEIEVEELLLSRYHDMNYIMAMPLDHFVRFLNKASREREDDIYRAQWNALFPYMCMKRLKFMSFNEYRDKLTGRNIDTRSNEEIIADIQRQHKQAFDEEVTI